MSAPSLYTLTRQYQELLALDTDASDDIAMEALRNTLEGIEGEIQIVASDLGAEVRNLEYYAQAAKDAGKALIERSNRINKRADAIREHIRIRMAVADIKKIESPQLTLLRKLNPPAVLIGEDAEIPDECMDDPHPMIAAVVAAARALPGNEDEDAPLMLTAEQLIAIVSAQLPAREPSKAKLRQALKSGELIPGVSLQQGESLQIK